MPAISIVLSQPARGSNRIGDTHLQREPFIRPHEVQNATKRDGMLKRLIRDGLIEVNNVPSGKGRPSRVVTRTATATTTNDW